MCIVADTMELKITKYIVWNKFCFTGGFFFDNFVYIFINNYVNKMDHVCSAIPWTQNMLDNKITACISKQFVWIHVLFYNTVEHSGLLEFN